MIVPASSPVEMRTIILVVEDEVLIRMAIADYLRETGCQVVEARTADEAWEFLRTSDNVGLVFSDVRMPGSIDGLKLALKVREAYPNLPIVLASGHLLANEADGIPFLRKPYGLPEAAAKILSLLNEKTENAIDRAVE